MKRCPTCQRTYEGSLKFCQADGTPLIDEASGSPSGSFDRNASDVSSDYANSDLDPMKTMVGAPPANLPPPSPFSDPPRSSDLNSPSFGDLGSAQIPPASYESAPESSRQPFDNYSNAPDNFGGAPSFKEPEPQFGSQPNFGQPSPFGQSPAEWSAPPAPQDWQNQGLGQNTPFSTPPVGAKGLNQTLAIISLVTGILGLCCGLLGPVGVVTGYMAYNNVNKDPQQYGGKGLALAGMIVGGIATLLLILGIIIQVLGLLAR